MLQNPIVKVIHFLYDAFLNGFMVFVFFSPVCFFELGSNIWLFLRSSRLLLMPFCLAIKNSVLGIILLQHFPDQIQKTLSKQATKWMANGSFKVPKMTK